MNRIKRFGIFLMTLFVEIIFFIIFYNIYSEMFKFINAYYISFIICVCFFVSVTRLYKYIFYKKFNINLNNDILIIFTAPLIICLILLFFAPILGWVLIIPFVLNFYILLAYLIVNTLIWGYKKYTEKREMKEHIKNIKEKIDATIPIKHSDKL